MARPSPSRSAKKCLGRIFNLLGEPVDNQPAPQDVERWAIHRDPPPYDEQETSAEILETGIKVVDLIAPYAKGGKSACSAARASAKPFSSWS